jgi:SAM-dependent methyltransferase
MRGSQYDNRFFQAIDKTSAQSAAICVPLFLEMMAPRSVLDYGCGQGNWLREFLRLGITDCCGVDGDYVDRNALVISRDRFVAWDLATRYDPGRRFDLALSLEVGEHLPASAVPAYLESLTTAASRIVFSAAVPGQGGVQHVNEQWPWYWQRLFEQRGFVCLDPFRPLLWQNDAVAQYYRQNLFLYVDPGAHPELVSQYYRPVIGDQLTLVQSYILEGFTRPPLSFRKRLARWARGAALRSRLFPGERIRRDKASQGN